MSAQRRLTALKHVLLAIAATGTGLLGVNAAGLLVPPRAADIDTSYSDFSRAGTLTYADARARLNALEDEPDPQRLVTEATRVFHRAIAHVEGADVKERGYRHYRLLVSPWENWILYLLDFVKPAYEEDGYRFCDYNRALKRGVGWCEQKAMALTGYLRERGLETGVVTLGGHVVSTARVENRGWYLLDADYGGVVPFGLEAAQAAPASVLPHYWSPAAQERSIERYFGPEGNDLALGGPEVRYPRACRIESLAYSLKWSLPLAMVAGSLGLLWLQSRRPA